MEKATATDYNQVFLVCNEELVAVAEAISPDKNEYSYTIAAPGGLIDKAFKTGELVNAGDVEDKEKWPGYIRAVPQTRSELVVPIRSGNVIRGVLNSESEELDHYTNPMHQKLQEVAADLGYLLPLYDWGTSTLEQLPLVKREPRARHHRSPGD